MRVLIDNLPRESALLRAQFGEFVDWTTTDYLLALVVDKLSVIVWQPTKDGHSDRPQHFPTPLRRPGEPEREPPAPSVNRAGRTAEEQRALVDAERVRLRPDAEV